jgi:NTE family protein
MTYNTLVLSGGSVKGFSILGVVQYAFDNHFLDNITTYSGTSIGSIICYLLAIGCSPTEILVYICTKKINQKLNVNILNMIQGEGASSFMVIQEHLEKITIEKIGFFLTLKDLQEKFGKTLICATYNLDDDCVEYLSPESHPDLPCITALRMSSNVPLLFEKFKYMNKHYVDGGIYDNFPIEVVDKPENKILGITVGITVGKSSKADETLLEYVLKLITIASTQNSKYFINKMKDKHHILELDTASTSFLSLNLQSKQVLDLFSSGYNQAKEYFSSI